MAPSNCPISFKAAGGTSCRSDQVTLIHDERVEPFLPQVPPPALAEIDHPGVAPMGFTQGIPQTKLRRRHQNQIECDHLF